MSYKVKKKDGKFCIIENNLLTVTCYDDNMKANGICRGLNLGKGFAGNTPKFMVTDFFEGPITETD